jgi:hypothetical protein
LKVGRGASVSRSAYFILGGVTVFSFNIGRFSVVFHRDFMLGLSRRVYNGRFRYSVLRLGFVDVLRFARDIK